MSTTTVRMSRREVNCLLAATRTPYERVRYHRYSTRTSTIKTTYIDSSTLTSTSTTLRHSGHRLPPPSHERPPISD
eukprot:scaffold360528_cov17-Prasinocladus_malaysianus.AAC.1